MNHEQTIDKLGAWLDGELPPDRADAVRRHVEQCPACAARVDELKSLARALDQLPARTPSRDFARRVRRAAEPARERILVLEPFRRVRPALLRVAAGLVVLGGLAVGILAGSRAPSAVVTPPATPGTDPAVDALSAAPEGSVADAALAFYTGPDGGETP
jgi:anti-sigma factor RsiW